MVLLRLDGAERIKKCLSPRNDKIVSRSIEGKVVGGLKARLKREKACAQNDVEFVTFIITPELIEKVFFLCRAQHKAKRAVTAPFVVVIMKLEHAVTSNNRITPFASLETAIETRLLILSNFQDGSHFK